VSAPPIGERPEEGPDSELGRALEGVVEGLHHVAIAVPDLEVARRVYEGVLGLRACEVEHVPEQGVRVLVLFAGDQRIELVEPAREDSPISRFIARRGAGLHHVAWRVRDVDLALERVRAAGLELIDEVPGPGSNGTRVAFLHPRATGGVLTELVEECADGEDTAEEGIS